MFLSLCLPLLGSFIYWFLVLMLVFLKCLLILGSYTFLHVRTLSTVYKCYLCLLQDALLWLQRGQTGGQNISIIHLLSIGGLSSSRVTPTTLRLWPKFITSVPAREHLSLLHGIKVRLDPYPPPMQHSGNHTDFP